MEIKDTSVWPTSIQANFPAQVGSEFFLLYYKVQLGV